MGGFSICCESHLCLLWPNGNIQMPAAITYILFVIGFVLLIKGADFLVDGASAIARRFKVSDLVIGLTVVAFGTSTPELFVNILASAKGNKPVLSLETLYLKLIDYLVPIALGGKHTFKLAAAQRPFIRSICFGHVPGAGVVEDYVFAIMPLQWAPGYPVVVHN